MRHKKATDYHNSLTFQQLWDALGSKLIEAAQGRLTLNQPVQGSTPWRLTLATNSEHRGLVIFRTTFWKVVPRIDKTGSLTSVGPP